VVGWGGVVGCGLAERIDDGERSFAPMASDLDSLYQRRVSSLSICGLGCGGCQRHITMPSSQEGRCLKRSAGCS